MQFWKRLSKTQRTAILAVSGVFIITMVIMSVLLSQTEYESAFNDLNAQDAQAIINYLVQNNIQYKLSSDGLSIAVPSKDAPAIKVAVSSQGLLTSGSIGFDIFKNNVSSFGMPDNEFSVLKTDALAGEIQKMLNSVEGVSSSKVILQTPTEDVFLDPKDDQETASASVVIHMKAGYKLTEEIVDSMYNLVSKAVKNLPIENITLSNQYGDFLAYSKADNMATTPIGMASNQMQIRQQYETDVQKNIQKFLRTILGQRKVVVSVFANLNFDQKRSNTDTYTPVVDQSGIARSVEEVTKSFSGSGGSSGTAGTGPNDIPGFPAAGSGGTSQSEESRKTVNYEINQVKSEITSSPYIVKSLTVSVGVEPPIAADPASLTQDKIDKIQNMLVNIVGTALSDSGQTLTDEEIAKHVLVFPNAFVGMPPVDEPSYILYYLLGGIAGFFLLYFAGKRFQVKRAERKEQERIQFEMEEAAERARNVVPDMDSPGGFDSEIRKQLESLARKKPEEFVSLLRTWLIDD